MEPDSFTNFGTLGKESQCTQYIGHHSLNVICLISLSKFCFFVCLFKSRLRKRRSAPHVRALTVAERAALPNLSHSG